jgi:hypothetical protein
MNSRSKPTAFATAQTIVFEPTSAGGGSFWNGDSLLATLTVLKRAERQGRLSLRDTNRALDLVCARPNGEKTFELVEAMHQIGVANWKASESSASLSYRGSKYLATQESLVNAQTLEPAITLALPSDWNSKQMQLHLADEADLALVGFYLFVAYDLANRSAGQPTGRR